jgi:hypothetical protein
MQIGSNGGPPKPFLLETKFDGHRYLVRVRWGTAFVHCVVFVSCQGKSVLLESHCVCVGLARTIYIRFIYGIFGLEITKYTVYINVYIYTVLANPTYVVWYLFAVCVLYRKLSSVLCGWPKPCFH